MDLITILLIFLIVFLIVSVGTWRRPGWAFPSSSGLVFIILVILLLKVLGVI